MPPAYILPTKYILFALSAEVSISPLHSGHKRFQVTHRLSLIIKLQPMQHAH